MYNKSVGTVGEGDRHIACKGDSSVNNKSSNWNMDKREPLFHRHFSDQGDTRSSPAAVNSTVIVRVSLMIRASLFWRPPSHPTSLLRAVMVVSLPSVPGSLANRLLSLLLPFPKGIVERLYGSFGFICPFRRNSSLLVNPELTIWKSGLR